MSAAAPDPRRLAALLADADLGVRDSEARASLAAALRRATIVERGRTPLIVADGRPVGRVGPHGSTTLYLPDPHPLLRHRALGIDRHGHLVTSLRRSAAGRLEAAWVQSAQGAWIGVLPGGAQHPLWGPSDRVVRLAEVAGVAPEPLTVAGAVDWDAIAGVPPLAEPARLPPGAGTAVLNLLAGSASDQEAAALRYRGPYPGEQLFWALAECFRFETSAPDPVAAFTAEAEAAFADGVSVEPPVDWIPAPFEPLFHDDGTYVQLRDGVEKVQWEGRTYLRTEWQGLVRREHRVIRRTTGSEGRPAYVAGLEALGQPLEDHLLVDARGEVLARLAPTLVADETPDAALAAPWREALPALLSLAATPLLATAVPAVWPALEVVWGTVPRDLIEVRGRTLRLSRTLARACRVERERGADPRALARLLVADVLALLGPPVRSAAAAWLEAEPGDRQQALLDAARRIDRRVAAAGAAVRLGPLLDGLAAGTALPG